MEESDYWDRLEYRVCRELARSDDRRIRSLWCDGFIPADFEPGGDVAAIRGQVWIGIGPRHQEEWEFTLLLRGSGGSRDAIDWQALTPDEELTGWLTLEPERRTMTIDLSGDGTTGQEQGRVARPA